MTDPSRALLPVFGSLSPSLQSLIPAFPPGSGVEPYLTAGSWVREHIWLGGNAGREIPGSGQGAQDGAGMLGSGRSAQPILAAGLDPMSGWSMSSWRLDSAPRFGLPGAPFGSTFLALQLPRPAWSRQKEGIWGFAGRGHVPAAAAQCWAGSLGWTGRAGLGTTGLSPRNTQIWGEPKLVGFAWRGDSSSWAICWREGCHRRRRSARLPRTPSRPWHPPCLRAGALVPPLARRSPAPSLPPPPLGNDEAIGDTRQRADGARHPLQRDILFG